MLLRQLRIKKKSKKNMLKWKKDKRTQRRERLWTNIKWLDYQFLANAKYAMDRWLWVDLSGINLYIM